MMKRRIIERVLVLIVSMAVLLSSTGVYSVFAQSYREIDSSVSTTIPSSTSTAASSDENKQTPTNPAIEKTTEPNIVAEGGSVTKDVIEGTGTSADPYKISSVDDLFKMQSIINNTRLKDKFFILTDDIDLSSVSYAQLRANTVLPGTIISVDKAKSDAVPNAVKFYFNGRNHKISGLNISNSGSDAVALFGYISAKSVVKNIVFENIKVNVSSKNAVATGALVLCNNGEFRSCTVNNVSVNVSSSANGNISSKRIAKALSINESTGVIAVNNGKVIDLAVKDASVNVQSAKNNIGLIGINNGSVSNVKLSGATIKAATGSDAIGAVAGRNTGKIENATVESLKANVNGKAAFGGIAGVNSGSIVSCVASGSAYGSNCTGGIVGKAVSDNNAKTSNVKNCASFVRVDAALEIGAVVAKGETRYSDNIWSSENSGRACAYANGETAGDMVRDLRYVVVKAGSTKVINKAEFGGKFGNAAYVLDSTKAVSCDGSGISFSETENAVAITAQSADKVGKITFAARIAVDAGYNNSSVVSKNFTVAVLTVPENSKGDGLTEATPIEIGSGAGLKMIAAAPYANFILTKNVTLPESWDSSLSFTGSLNGNGYKLKASKPLFSSVYGKVSNLNVVLCGKINTAMFGKAVNAEFNKVKLLKGTAKDGNSFIGLSANKNCTGAFLNKVIGSSKLNECFTNVPVSVASGSVKGVAGFIGMLDSSKAVITSCGAVTSMTSANGEKLSSCAAFIANTSDNSNGKIKDCYATLYSDVTDYVFVVSGDKQVNIENSYFGSSNKKAVAAPKSFTNVNANKWMFKSGEQGFVTGSGSSVAITLPSNIVDASKVSAKDFSVMYDASVLKVNAKAITVKNGAVYVPVEAVNNKSTIKNSALVIVHKTTGLRAEIGISNGLEKDGNGNYLINSGADFGFINSNFNKFKDKNFILKKDIDMSDVDFDVVGGATKAFSGTFNGKNHTISGLKVSSKAKAGLFGALDGATVKDITFKNAVVKSGTSYAGVLASQITNKSTVSGITFKNCKVEGKENYAGILAGEVKDSKVSDIEIIDSKVSALNDAGILAGYAKSAEIKDVKAEKSTAAGDNNIGLVGLVENSAVKSVSVDDAKLTAKRNVGGVAGSAEKAKISKADVSDSEIKAAADALGAAPVAGGICGDFSGKISNAVVKSSKITADGNAAVAGGIVAAGEKSEVVSSAANEGVKVNASVAGGIIGEANGETTIKNSKSCAAVTGSDSASKVIEGTGGIIGRVTADDFGDITIEKTNSAGTVKAADYAGGLIGSVLSQKATEKSIKDCVSAAKVVSGASDENTTSGHVIGATPELNGKDIKKAVSGVVYSSYASDVPAYGDVKADGTYSDLDKAVKASLKDVITDKDEVKVKVANSEAEKLGFVFDSAEGWQSESEKRIDVVDSTENQVTLKAEKTGIVGIVGTYTLDGDDSIDLEVGFTAESKIDVVLKGEGTKESPYIISNASELEGISAYADKNAYFTLTQDIAVKAEEFDFGGEFYNEGKGFTPIGTSEVPFNGVFMGNGHTISGIKISDVENGALFGYTDGATITDINVKDMAVSAEKVAAVVVANAVNTEIKNVNVSDSSAVAESEQGNAAAVVAYANGSNISDVTVKSTEITSCTKENGYNVACAGAVSARAIDTTISNADVDESVKVTSDGSAAGLVGYGDNAVINSSKTFADVTGCFASAVVANVKGVLKADGIVAGGKVSGKEFTAGITAKAYDVVKVANAVISAEINGEDKIATLVAYADEDVFTDSEDCEVDFSNITYSSYQNDAKPFASAKINAYQNALYLDKLVDVNSLTAKDGQFVFVGKDEVKVADQVKSDYDISSLNLVDVYSEPENLVKYNSENGTVTAIGTAIEDAKLVMKFDNGLEAAVALIAIKDAEGKGTTASPYIINSEDTLKLLNLYPNAVFSMKSDVSLSEEWTPVENFTGVLDGNGFEISGLKVKADNAGLFAAMSGSATVRNVVFSNAEVEGKTSAGVVTASMTDKARISGVSIVSSDVKADEYAAAIAGTVQASGAKISSSSVTGSTISAKDAAGIAALVSGKADITSSTVDATEIKGTDAAGGVVAVASADALNINGCDVTADVSADNAGAIVGVTDKAVNVASCVANGTVNGKTTEGGIIGLADGIVKITGSKAFAKLSGEAKNVAALVAKFVNRPADDENFAKDFSNNTIDGEYDEFEPAIMKYQNFDPAQKEEEKDTLEGSGTKEDPYIIASAADLAKIPDSSTAYYSLLSDITITEKDYGISIDKNGETVYGVFSEGYKPIKNFAGVFNGNGHVIKGLYIDSVSDYVGLFANVTGNGAVRNLHVELLDGKDFSGIKGADYVGGIAGYCDSTNGIENCSVVGASVSGDHAVGGVVGGLASSQLINSFAMCKVNAQNKAGGLAGVTSGKALIKNCFTTCDVNAAGGVIVGTNNGALTLTDVMANGSSHGTDALAVAVNNGTIKAEKVLVAGSNDDNKTAVFNADEAEYAYADKTAIGIADSNMTGLTTSELTASKPEGLEGWAQSQGKYPVPVMADAYSNAKALEAATASTEEAIEETIGNLKVNYKLVNNSGDKAMDSALVGVLIKSKANGTTITSDFFTKSGDKAKSLNKLLVTTGGFYIDSSLPAGYKFVVTAKDSNGKAIDVSDAGSLGAYVQCGNASEISLTISIVKVDIPWGLTSLWESLKR
ncbi:MAG: hypothetical protein MJ147_07365 [Clostridia bacterium]|nr:hypothetical protein [Clostridia bacterium]